MADWATEHLVNFVLDLCAALFAAWLFLRFQPSISDHLARRSKASRERKVAKLKRKFADYEECINDPQRFLGRLILNAVWAIISLVLLMGIVSTGLMGAILYRTNSEIVILWFHQLVSIASSFFVFILFNLSLQRLRNEANPKIYRERVMERIGRLLSTG